MPVKQHEVAENPKDKRKHLRLEQELLTTFQTELMHDLVIGLINRYEFGLPLRVHKQNLKHCP